MSDFITFRLLAYIKAVAETLNFSRAAQRLFLSQPTLSHQIRELEDQLEFSMFERARSGMNITDAGRLMATYAENAIRERDEVVLMARAIYRRKVPPLRLGFSSFISAHLLQEFRQDYEEMFPGCEIQLSGAEPLLILERTTQGQLDCAILPMPINEDLYCVQQISRSPLVVCMCSDDPLAGQSQLDIHEVAPRVKIFRDPELQPAAHGRLTEMFQEVGIELAMSSSARTPADIQWMVKGGYGLALVDQLMPLEPGLITRPIAGVNWTVDTAFVHRNRADHIALPFVEKMFLEKWRSEGRKRGYKPAVRPEQLKLLA